LIDSVVVLFTEDTTTTVPRRSLFASLEASDFKTIPQGTEGASAYLS
jgi:hypothetical protein